MAKRDHCKVILFQLRDNDETKKIDFESYVRATKLAPNQIVAVDVFERPPQASVLDGAHAVIVGGSKWSVWEDVPNQAALIDVLKAAREKKIPILGVCFGAQLLAHAFGGQVVRDEEHAEWGTFDVETSDDALMDMLFADAPFSFPAQCAHHDRIAKLPPAATVLASSKNCSVQAFVIPGTDIYGVQFHPERSKRDYETLLAMRGRDYSADQSNLERIKASLKETPAAEDILAKFIDRIVVQK
jgi:GMP synthase (glutamine-hydrolysing)